MIIVGDIGNTETKICLVNSKNIIIKRVTLLTKKINQFLVMFNKIFNGEFKNL